MILWRVLLWHLLWCCATIAALVFSQAIYPWVWIWATPLRPIHAF